MTNVYDEKLALCGSSPLTGYLRTGFCQLDPSDEGTHTVCAIMTPEFLHYTFTQGNDLITKHNSFPGLKPGNKWCVCALRWLQAYKAGVAPPVIGASTNSKTLRIIPYRILRPFLVDI